MPQVQQGEVSPSIIRACSIRAEPLDLLIKDGSGRFESRQPDLEISIKSAGFAGPSRIPSDRRRTGYLDQFLSLHQGGSPRRHERPRGHIMSAQRRAFRNKLISLLTC